MEPGTNVLLTFGDSSGNPSCSAKSIADTPHYIIVTITVGVREAHRLDALIQELKIKYFGKDDPEQAEFHASALRNRLFWETRNLALVDKRFAAIFDDIVDIVLNMNAVINVVIMDKRPTASSSGSIRTMINSWGYASYLLRQTLLKFPFDMVSMIMLDRYDDKTNKIVRDVVEQSLRPLVGVGDSIGRAVMPRPVFADSGFSNLIQLVDMIAYIVSRANRGKDAGLFSSRYAMLEPKFSNIFHATAK